MPETCPKCGEEVAAEFSTHTQWGCESLQVRGKPFSQSDRCRVDELEELVEDYATHLSEAEDELDRFRQQQGELRKELAEAKAALLPFARMGIPPNWPGQCRLRIDTRNDSSEYVSYHGEAEAALGILPTIAEWREAAKAAGGDDEKDRKIRTRLRGR
jgi:hypothetical protein